jgi:hypothetical protein
MMAAHKLACHIAALVLATALAGAPAKAQFAPFGGTGGDMMTQMAPMIEMMKAKMGKRRFAAMMQTMGPMMSRMMEGGGLGGNGGFAPDGYGMGMNMGGNDIMGMLDGNGGGEMISMIPQLMQMTGASFGGAHGRMAPPSPFVIKR